MSDPVRRHPTHRNFIHRNITKLREEGAFLENENYENSGARGEGENTRATWVNRNYFLRKFHGSS